ncbi:DUF4097 domain-containing protein [Planotetraspora sp. A-T 1434]|uniref:DUF4097 domain-containing protein n=1 Tax=Planotetraspora sp. A-T 1434 TaxID=2979219 RepID=UPI0021C044A2|nr:DUF4097 domain-containing protein [Planotetraspora sp. A-T 1434]MCT9932949.1 DUF4097 domain-containing protein [Planotetraspora sp. A-T 1434]
MRKQTLIVAGTVLGAGLALTACDLKVDFGGEQATESYDVADKVAVLDAHTGSGDIVVNESDRSGVHVTETLHWRGEKPRNGHSVSGGTLTLDYNCHDCWIDYRVEVPRGLDVKIDSGSGTITLRQLTGPVVASTGSGDVDARGLAGKNVSASTGSGDVKLRFAAVPDQVHAETGSGDGLVWVPSGAYNVTTETGSGDRDVQVTQDPSAPRTIVVKTGSGDAKIYKTG